MIPVPKNSAYLCMKGRRDRRRKTHRKWLQTLVTVCNNLKSRLLSSELPTVGATSCRFKRLHITACLSWPPVSGSMEFWWLRGAKYQSFVMQYLVVKSAKMILFWFKGFLSAIFVLQEVVRETYFCLTQEQSSTGRAQRVAGQSLAQVIRKTGALHVCKEPVTILAEVNQMCWPNYIAHNNILPILIWHCFQFMMIFTTTFHDPV